MKKAPITSLVLAGGLVLSANSIAFAATGSDIVKTGEQFIGKPYLYGAPIGDVNAFDCSSFTAIVFKNNGIALPRTSSAQSKVGTLVQKNDLQTGDLVFFDTDFNGSIDHVGIYIGAGQMINAIISGVGISNVNSTYWAPRYVTARRVLNQTAATPTAAPASSSSASNSPSEDTAYTVKSGDTLTLIGLHYGISVSDLKAFNKLTSDTIFPGQTLKLSGTPIPSSMGTSPKAAQPANHPAEPVIQPVTYKPAEPSVYKVQPGDSLWEIAHHFNLSIASLESINKLKNDRIYVGQTLSLKKPTTPTVPKQTNLVSQKPAKLTPVANYTPSEPSTAKPSSTTKTTVATYTVKKGDTLSKIAYKHKLSLTDLIAYNHLTSSLIFPGQKIKVSKPSAAPSKSTIKVASVESQLSVTSLESHVNGTSDHKTTPLTYTVKKGDTLWDIAVLHDTNTKKLMKANNLTSPFIFPGQKLNLA